MAKLVGTNLYVAVNSVVVASNASQVDIQSSRAQLDATSFGDTSIEYLLGLNDVSFVVTFWNDYAVGALDSQLFALHQTSTPFPVEVRPVNSARSTSNPAYFLTGALMPEYHPINTSVGDVASTEVTFINANQAGLTRLTA